MLEVGSLTDVVTVSTPLEIIQTETGAREGVLRAEQIENLSVVGRSSLELLRILPGVVAPDNTAFESVSFGGGANNTQGYTVNGIRSSGNTVSLDGSALIDIGSNSGVIVTLNNDMVQEVKVQSSNFAAEYGVGRHERQRGHQGRQLAVPRRALRLQPRLRSSRPTTARTASPASTSRRASSTTPAATSAVRSSSPARFNKDRNKAVLLRRASKCSARRSTRARASASCRRVKQRAGRLQEFLTPNGQNLEPAGRHRCCIPAGSPAPARRRPATTSSPYITPLGRVLANPYPGAELHRSEQPFNYVLSQLEPTNRTDLKTRFDYNITQQHQGLRPRRASRAKRSRARAACGGARRTSRCRRPNLGTNMGRSVLRQRRHGAQPDDDQRGARVSWSRLTLDNTYKDPSKMTLAELRRRRSPAAVPGREPVHPRRRSRTGAAASATCGRRRTTCMRTTTS